VRAALGPFRRTSRSDRFGRGRPGKKARGAEVIPTHLSQRRQPSAQLPVYVIDARPPPAAPAQARTL